MATIRRSEPTLNGTLLARRKRFLADVQLADGSTLTAMCANTGSMATCNEPGRPVILSDSQNPERKLRYTWELIRMGRVWVNVNTGLPNRAVEEWVRRQSIPELAGYPYIRREVKYGHDGKSRIDLLLTHTPPAPKRKKDPPPEPLCKPGDAPDCYVEIKNTSMRAGDHSVFPDSVTTRGQKHLLELMEVVRQGKRAVMFYFCGRTDTRAFRPAREVDPKYAELLRQAVEAGVEVLPYQIHCTEKQTTLKHRLPLSLDT
jgi:sugar fermentation stimulation protein A